MNAPLTLTFGNRGTANVLESDGNLVLLDATFSSPPGSPLEGSAEGSTYKIKVRSSKKQPGDATRFLIEGRFYDLTKAQRERVTLRKAP
jgi:hypothetical protein